MTRIEPTPVAAALVAVDVAKLSNGVLIEGIRIRFGGGRVV